MALPKVIFELKSAVEERRRALKELEQWLDSNEVSATKTQVLRAGLNYAARNLIHLEPLNFDLDLPRFAIFNAIFKYSNLPDLLFLQQVINQMNTIDDETSDLKKAVLPLAQNFKRTLVVPLVREMTKATFGFEIMAVLMRNPGWILLAVARFFTPKLTAEAKVERMLSDRLAQALSAGQPTRFDDSFYEGLKLVATLAERSRLAVFSLFSRILQPERPVLAGQGPRFQPK